MVRTPRRRAIAPDPLADDGEHDEREAVACPACGGRDLSHTCPVCEPDDEE